MVSSDLDRSPIGSRRGHVQLAPRDLSLQYRKSGVGVYHRILCSDGDTPGAM
jgi:hypothetical protein